MAERALSDRNKHRLEYARRADLKTLAKGSEIASRFVITDRLGQGANGTVWKATDKTAARDVAIKILLDPHGDAAQYLLAEAQKWAKLEHENIIRLYDVRLNEGMLVMECAEGGSLERMMKQMAIKAGTLIPTAPCPTQEAVGLFTQILRGLAFAHEKGILHRDIKPGNILLSKYGIAKLSDFGMAREEGRSGSPRAPTAPGMSGTPEYMSPEQARGEDIYFQSDIFSAGIVGYQLFTGRHPFLHPSLIFHVRDVIADERIPCGDIHEAAPTIPEGVAAVIMRMLLKDKSARYSTARDILADLEQGMAAACLYCGSSNPVSNVFCGQCGVKLREVGADEKIVIAKATAETAPVVASNTQGQDVEDLIRMGFELSQKGDWDGAIRAYEGALAVDPNSSRAFANMGYAQNHLGLYDEAIVSLTKAIEIGDATDDNNPAPYAYRAFSYKNKRMSREALRDLDVALQMKPGDPGFLREKAYCLLELDEIDKAYACVLIGLRFTPGDEALLSLSRKVKKIRQP